ncbi:ATP-dependent DNA helicase RecG [Sulfuriferula sp. AH1]|uniref:ATP-dependent DNA helicase RecG n=1 Tax=Sulfuriferula sp. AH1 TaxID=1985873 RepID=UPI000B3B8B83|nr:ATP-dependent DNA helicase RecG [Sulfuriferula sp. AH1]ARU32604.1 ATP-dependent DNA helicase RecG [Sulfuriferula sp. AH1]
MATADKVAGLDMAAPLPAAFAKLGLTTYADLLLHLPLRYEDETRITPIANVLHGELAQVQGVVTHSDVQYKPRKQLVVRIADADGELSLRFLHFYGSQTRQFTPGNVIRAVGEARGGFFGVEMVHPRCRVVSADTPLPDSLTPVYPAAAGVSQTLLRKHIAMMLAQADLTDSLPEPLREQYRLMRFGESVLALHRPAPEASLAALADRVHPAWQRIKFDELLAQQLSLRLARQTRRALGAPVIGGDGKLAAQLLANLPFALTAAQQRVWQEIGRDMTEPYPMQRLLQGDVGSGKTVIAALAAAQAIGGGYQAAFMAPTEILAEQHFYKLRSWFEPLGVEVVWLTGSLAKKARQTAMDKLVSGEAMLAAGTHALFQEQVAFVRLGLAVIDEQHRFGVAQRLALRQKGAQPHQLMMSATPIPRTLSMSYYADLDVSVIDELPPGRTPIVTKLVADNRREELIGLVRDKCYSGAQVYWVCPLIEESEKLQLQTAVDTFTALSAALPGVRVDLVHGRMNSADKAAVMAKFAAGQVGLLVATTVIEVGVDVPNASLMVIEHAERMGLAQLHQLRGRVGRGAAKSVCVLLYQQPLSALARARLKIIFESADGFYIASEDLNLRGPGEFLGARQSGAPMLRFADLAEDADLLDRAQQAADIMLDKYPAAVASHLSRWLSGRQEFGKA